MTKKREGELREMATSIWALARKRKIKRLARQKARLLRSKEPVPANYRVDAPVGV